MEQNIEYINGIKTTTIMEDMSPLASSELKATRQAVCDTCDFKDGDICNSCMCLLDVKLSYVDSSCPEEKW